MWVPESKYQWPKLAFWDKVTRCSVHVSSQNWVKNMRKVCTWALFSLQILSPQLDVSGKLHLEQLCSSDMILLSFLPCKSTHAPRELQKEQKRHLKSQMCWKRVDKREEKSTDTLIIHTITLPLPLFSTFQGTGLPFIFRPTYDYATVSRKWIKSR